MLLKANVPEIIDFWCYTELAILPILQIPADAMPVAIDGGCGNYMTEDGKFLHIILYSLKAS